MDSISILECKYVYLQDEDVRGRIPQSPQRGNANQGFELSNRPIATTPIPLGFTTTRRPLNASPRVKSNIVLRNKNRGGPPKSGNLLKGGILGSRILGSRIPDILYGKSGHFSLKHINGLIFYRILKKKVLNPSIKRAISHTKAYKHCMVHYV